MANEIDAVIDWDKWEGGVFTYECLESSVTGLGNDLAAHLIRNIGASDWAFMIEVSDSSIPSPHEIQALIRDWAKSLSIETTPLSRRDQLSPGL